MADARVQGFASVERSVQRTEQAQAAATRRWRRAGDVGQRGGYVGELDQAALDAGSGSAWRLDDQRDLNRSAIKVHFRPEPVIAQHFAMVAGMNDPGVVELTQVRQRVDHVAHFLIDE